MVPFQWRVFYRDKLTPILFQFHSDSEAGQRQGRGRRFRVCISRQRIAYFGCGPRHIAGEMGLELVRIPCSGAPQIDEQQEREHQFYGL